MLKKKRSSLKLKATAQRKRRLANNKKKVLWRHRAFVSAL